MTDNRVATEKLLAACPFCGEGEKLEPVTDGVTEWIVCRKCGCDGPVARDPEQRDILWNRRARAEGVRHDG